jgi:2,4-dienoyl-CoA reductase-like NADH-dependent reductase (Old Yellow Enzyme family)
MDTASATITGGSTVGNFTSEVKFRAGRAQCAHDRFSGEHTRLACSVLRPAEQVFSQDAGNSMRDSPRRMLPSYQVPFSQRIREEVGIRTGAVGMISDAQFADGIITSGQANIVFLARELLREPYWAIKAQHALEEEPVWPIQYGYAVKRRTR